MLRLIKRPEEAGWETLTAAGFSPQLARLLAMRGARIYDLDADPARARRWTELPAVQAYYLFFKQHASDFESDD